jgi:hypothetical protein
MNYPIIFHQRFLYEHHTRGIFIPVTLVLGEAETTCGAKLDTGADYCYFGREHAEEIGIKLHDGHLLRVETNRPDQSMIFYGHEIRLQTLGYEVVTMVYFWEQYNLPRNLLGRAGWLNKFRIGLNEHDLELYLSHYDE